MDQLLALLAQPVGRLGAMPLTLGHVLGGMAVAMLFAFWLVVRRVTRATHRDARAAEQSRQLELLAVAQTELAGRIGALSDVFASRHDEINQTLHARLDGMAGKLGQSLADQTRATHENLARLQERLAVIDTAQGNIQALAGQVVELQSILANKQTRGAFGQGRMEAIIADALPQGAYEFQATLSNGSRPDCLIHMPNGAPRLVVDAKFPLEAWNAIRNAESDEAARIARQRFRRDIEVHIRDISQKYLIAGETQETAFMFVPSESVFGEIHENFEALVHRAHKARVVIVSPSLLMLSVQVVQSVLKDARMREQAHLIQGEVAELAADVTRLNERVAKLQGHFAQANGDIDQILVSTSKIARRGARIEAMDFDRTDVARGEADAVQPQGRLRLRLAGEE
ncbi:MAG: DNA recombination protein RmuC [Notoacmeibacter sp.]|nr:DNA recombination protein RmuC [Notoacmeibacter sp.]